MYRLHLMKQFKMVPADVSLLLPGLSADGGFQPVPREQGGESREHVLAVLGRGRGLPAGVHHQARRPDEEEPEGRGCHRASPPHWIRIPLLVLKVRVCVWPLVSQVMRARVWLRPLQSRLLLSTQGSVRFLKNLKKSKQIILNRVENRNIF